MWFNEKHIKRHKPIKLENLHGYVLPHTRTTYSGTILSHTLRFKPTKQFDIILIIYLPSNNNPNVGQYHHEYYVPFKTLNKMFPNKKYMGYNILSNTNPDISKLNKGNTLYIISADFSHFLELQDAIKKENCAANSLMHKRMDISCTNVVDDIRSFNKLYEILPDISLQWIGRTRSNTEKGVGYLSFLLRDKPNTKVKIPDAFFVTAYDKNMISRECLGNVDKWDSNLETKLINDVIYNAKTTSRLTGGINLNIPVTNYTVTYLYKDRSKQFIRGWHAILKDALYLPNVFLENTYDNGLWFKQEDTKWHKGSKFNMKYTFKKLLQKSRKKSRKLNNKYTLFYSEQIHYPIK